jgi:spore germination cell wall hydrolase CwlJ-like protein
MNMSITKKRSVWMASAFSLVCASVLGFQTSIAQGANQSQNPSSPNVTATADVASNMLFNQWAEKNLPGQSHPFLLFHQVQSTHARNKNGTLNSPHSPANVSSTPQATAQPNHVSQSSTDGSSVSAGAHQAATVQPHSAHQSHTPASSAAYTTNTAVQHDSVYWLSHVIEAEAGGESQQAKMAVGEVIMNRISSPEYPKNIHDVIFQVVNGRYAFTSVQIGTVNRAPSAASVSAAQAVLSGNAHVVPDALVFYNASQTPASSWVRTQPTVATVDHLTFAR